MVDFSRPYRGVQYFGIAFEETADVYGVRDAMRVLRASVERTADQDLRHDRGTLEALDFLTGLHGGRLPAARAFQAALAIEYPAERQKALTAAYRHLSQVLFRGLVIDL